MNFWLPVIIIGLGTFAYRYSFMGGRLTFSLPASLKKSLEFVPVSVMAALVALGFFLDERGDFSIYPPSLTAAVAAAATALYFKRDLLTIVIGLAVYWTVRNFLLA